MSKSELVDVKSLAGESVTGAEVEAWKLERAAVKEFLASVGSALLTLKSKVTANNRTAACAERFLRNQR